MGTLYELTEELSRILEEVDDAIMPEQYDEFLLTHKDYITKASNYTMLIKELSSEADQIKEEIERLTARRRARENSVAWFRKSLELSMIRLEISSIKTKLFDITIQNNPPSVQINDINTIPEAYITHLEPVANKALMLKDMKRNIAIPGVELKTSKSLRIR